MIEFGHVSKSYSQGIYALNDVSLFIDKGEFLFLTGESGAGKTTLLKHIFMEEFPTHGVVSVLGVSSGGQSNNRPKRKEVQQLRRKVGVVFQDMRLLHDRDIFENIAYAARITRYRESEVRKATYNALSVVGLSHKSCNFPEELSGGEQQRVAIARAIINDPLVLIADEPTGNLDRRISNEIFSLLEEINSWGTTVLMSTHDLTFVERTHYRQLVLDKGLITKGGGSRVRNYSQGF